MTVKQEGDPMIREYNYAQLHDLQSRLMLVAGKAEMGKDDVDRFILVCYCFYQLMKYIFYMIYMRKLDHEFSGRPFYILFSCYLFRTCVSNENG